MPMSETCWAWQCGPIAAGIEEIERLYRPIVVMIESSVSGSAPQTAPVAVDPLSRKPTCDLNRAWDSIAG